ncbi:alpha/beta fold hydrolase [Nitriliruptor alkaliphilus]|uniref:alpha/beta fold hydrolase n=1 Tax=Nitriliruptor alkaliphilus TaxID=427918 RepID=UPI001B805A74|nr:alpha/beta hydrolase [Nitriliruptor alkaliphilus]
MPRIDPADLAHVGGPPIGEAVTLSDGASTDVHVAGPDDGAVVLLVAGLGQQRTAWPPEALAALHDAGYRTVGVDNRDVGRGHVHAGTPFDLPRGADGWPQAPYSLARMAADHVEVLDHLGIDRAHVLGVSMGGMIAQRIALSFPTRTASLTSVMSTTGARRVGQPTERAKPALTSVPPHGDRDAYVAYQVELQAIIGTSGAADPDRAAARARVAFARGVHEWGSARQLLAIRGDGDRTALLGGVSAPTLVLHGEDDPLIDVSGGHATAAAIPGARLVTIAGWGHDLPVSHLDRIVPPVLAHLARAG